MKFSWARAGTWAIALIVGAVYGVAGTIAHATRWGWLPIGLILAIVGSAALLVAVRALTSDRWAALAAGIGMILAVFLIGGKGPGGSVIVPEGDLDSIGWLNLGVVWTIAVPVLVIAVVLWPDRERVRTSDVD